MHVIKWSVVGLLVPLVILGHARPSAAPAAPSFSGLDGYSKPITFSEFPEGTDVSDSYRGEGVLFGGAGPTIVKDDTSFGSQVLSGGPDGMGDITGRYVLPGTSTPAPVYRMGFDIGPIEGVDSVRLEFFGQNGEQIGAYSAPSPVHFRIGQNGCNVGIYSWSASIFGSEPDGFGIDNL